jgi:hypothetical protein
VIDVLFDKAILAVVLLVVRARMLNHHLLAARQLHLLAQRAHERLELDKGQRALAALVVAVKHAPQLGRLLLRELAAQLGHGRRRPSLRSARVPATSHVCEDRFLPPLDPNPFDRF